MSRPSPKLASKRVNFLPTSPLSHKHLKTPNLVLNDLSMDGYASQEEAIYAQATARGISHDVVYKKLEESIDYMSGQYLTKSDDRRVAKAEHHVWRNFCALFCSLT